MATSKDGFRSTSIRLDPHLQEDLIAIVTITTHMTEGGAMTGTALTIVIVGEMEQAGMIKEVGTDQPDRGVLSVTAIMGDGMFPTLPVNNLRSSQQSRKVAAVVVGAMVTMAFGGSKALVVLEEAAGDRKGIGPTKIRSDLVSGRKVFRSYLVACVLCLHRKFPVCSSCIL